MATVFGSIKGDVLNTYDRVAETNPLAGLIGGLGNNISDPKNDGYKIWKEPTSDGSGRAYLRKKDDMKGVDYLYDRIVTRTPMTRRNVITGQMEPVMTKTIFGTGEPEQRYTTTVSYKRVKLAPGQSPEGYRREQQPRRYKANEESGGSSQSYATRRSQAGARGTILTGRQGTNLGAGGGKTVLGG